MSRSPLQVRVRPRRHLVPERHRGLDLGLPIGDVITNAEILHEERLSRCRQTRCRRFRRFWSTLSTCHPRRLEKVPSAGTHEGSHGEMILNDSLSAQNYSTRKKFQQVSKWRMNNGQVFEKEGRLPGDFLRQNSELGSLNDLKGGWQLKISTLARFRARNMLPFGCRSNDVLQACNLEWIPKDWKLQTSKLHFSTPKNLT